MSVIDSYISHDDFFSKEIEIEEMENLTISFSFGLNLCSWGL